MKANLREALREAAEAAAYHQHSPEFAGDAADMLRAAAVLIRLALRVSELATSEDPGAVQYEVATWTHAQQPSPKQGAPPRDLTLTAEEVRRVKAIGKPFVILVSRHGTPVELGEDTLEDAIRSAWATEENEDGMAWWIVDAEGRPVLDEDQTRAAVSKYRAEVDEREDARKRDEP